MAPQENRIPTLIIALHGAVVSQKSLSTYEDIEWAIGVFEALRTLSVDGRYQLYLAGRQESDDEAVVNRILETLSSQRIVIEELIDSLDSVTSVDREHSMIIGLEERALDVRHLPFTDWAGLIGELVPDHVRELRRARIERQTKETKIELSIDLDGTGKVDIVTGMPFFDHMLQQVARHGRLDIRIRCVGDLEVDEHHSVEDVAIVLGQALVKALGDKRGISRYGFELLPMDECLAQVAIDFSGRPWFMWDVSFSRDCIGTFPTELFSHFFKSFCDEARCNLHMRVGDGNAHHQAEALFKAFGRAIRRAVFRYPGNNELPSTKGVL